MAILGDPLSVPDNGLYLYVCEVNATAYDLRKWFNGNVSIGVNPVPGAMGPD